jgi:hypothetical protein
MLTEVWAPSCQTVGHGQSSLVAVCLLFSHFAKRTDLSSTLSGGLIFIINCVIEPSLTSTLSDHLLLSLESSTSDQALRMASSTQTRELCPEWVLASTSNVQ